MASLKITYVFASLFCVMVIFRQAEALICFECNSHNDTRCSQDIPPDVMQKNCDDHRDGTKYTMCRKITQIIEFEVNGLPPDSRVIRGCGWDESNYKGRCYQRSGFGGRQEVCSCLDDLCNGVGAATGSLITLAVGLVTLLVTRAAF